MKRKVRGPLLKTAAKYRRARRSLREPISARSRHGLDWTNFFVSDVQTSFGSFVAFYLAGLNWSKPDVGLVLTIGGLAAVISLVPGGALADEVPNKRILVACGIIALAGAALIYALIPTFHMVVLAEGLHGVTAGLIGPAISAISLGLVGRRAMSARTGRNQRFQAAGTAITAALMGLIGARFSTGAIFFATAGFCVPALFALSLIRPEEIDYHRARNAQTGEKSRDLLRILDLAKNRPLLAFAGCLMLLQLADALCCRLSVKIWHSAAAWLPSRCPDLSSYLKWWSRDWHLGRAITRKGAGANRCSSWLSASKPCARCSLPSSAAIQSSFWCNS
jgi:MFS family permease